MESETGSTITCVTFKRFCVAGLDSIATLLPRDQRRGIYVLEFANGEQYVGQALNVVTRFAARRHGSGHHRPWKDIVAFQFFSVPEGHLTPMEFDHIARLRGEGVQLRNRVGNLGHRQPSNLDEFIPVENQEHWVLGQGSYGVCDLPSIAGGCESKLTHCLRKRNPQLLTRILDDLNFTLRYLIPNVSDLEGEFWTLSDFPNTSGGRFATLNLGLLEFLYFPRVQMSFEGGAEEYCVFMNFPDGAFIDEHDWQVGAEFVHPDCPNVVFGCNEYTLCKVDCVRVPVGNLAEFMESDMRLLEVCRGMVIELMRQSNSNLFRRWHSRSLVREAICHEATYWHNG